MKPGTLVELRIDGSATLLKSSYKINGIGTGDRGLVLGRTAYGSWEVYWFTQGKCLSIHPNWLKEVEPYVRETGDDHNED